MLTLKFVKWCLCAFDNDKQSSDVLESSIPILAVEHI